MPVKRITFLLNTTAVAISVHALTDEEKAKVRELATGCLDKTSVDKDLIGKARKQEYTERNPQLAAYYTCMMTGMAFQKADGTFDTDRMAEKLPGSGDRDSAVKAIKKCSAHDIYTLKMTLSGNN
ncbi:uncharacterized protein [Atheta coriaria]|uniref:uncharacterized protein n=1 Tax=Dalotia coriaria TaxID=877792 RepID=UPI0031F3444C